MSTPAKKLAQQLPTTSIGPTQPATARLVSRKSLKQHPFNAPSRIRDVRALAADIAEVGMLNPIDVLSDGTIMNGHRRDASAGLLGWTQVYVTVHPTLTHKDWGKFNKSTRQISGSEWLYAWAVSNGHLDGMTHSNVRKCQRLKSIFGSYKDLEDIAKAGVGVGCLTEIDKITNTLADYEEFRHADGRPEFSTKDVASWMIRHRQTHRSRQLCGSLAAGVIQRHVFAKRFAKAIRAGTGVAEVKVKGRVGKAKKVKK